MRKRPPKWLLLIYMLIMIIIAVVAFLTFGEKHESQDKALEEYSVVYINDIRQNLDTAYNGLLIKKKELKQNEFLKAEIKQDFVLENEKLSKELDDKNKKILDLKNKIEKQKQKQKKNRKTKDDEDLEQLSYTKNETDNRTVNVVASYYTSNCEGCTGIVFSGYDVRNTIYYNGMRIIAVDTNVIPLHSVVKVETPYNTFRAIALDVGSAINNRRIDVLVGSKSKAFSLGMVKATVTVLKEG